MIINEYRANIIRAEAAVADLPRWKQRAAFPIVLAHMLKDSEQQSKVEPQAKAGKVK